MVAQIDRHYLATGASNVLVRAASYAAFEGRPVTTRGQWVNPWVARLLRRMARAEGVVPTAPIFIVGLGRSGTTLLGQVLSTHPDVGWLNEPKLMWHVIHPDEDLIGSYSTSGTTRVRLGAADATPDVASRAAAVTSSYLRSVRRRRLVDKYPELIYRLDFVRALFPDAKFLALQRSAEGSASSIATWSDAHRVGADDWWGRDGRKWRLLHSDLVSRDEMLSEWLSPDPSHNDPLHMAVTEWLLTAEEVVRESHAADLTVVRYEDLAEDPVATMRDVCDFVGLPHSPVMERFASDVCKPGRDASGLLVGKVPARVLARVRAAEDALGLRGAG